MRHPLLAAVLLSALGTAAGAADEIVRTDGRKFVGVVQSADRAGLTLKPSLGDAVEVATADIARVSWDGEPSGLSLVRNVEAAGRLGEARDGYREALSDLQSNRAFVRQDLEFLLARTLAALAARSPSDDAAAAEAREALSALPPDSFRRDPSLKVLADLHRARGEFDEAAAAYTALSESPVPRAGLAGRTELARLALSRGDAAGAKERFARIAADAAEQELPDAALAARLGGAAADVSLGDAGPALAESDAILSEADPSDAAVRAGAYLRRGDALRALGRPKEALLAYLHVDTLFPAAAEAHAESLLRLSELWAELGLPARATDAAVKLKTRYPNSEWAARVGG